MPYESERELWNAIERSIDERASQFEEGQRHARRYEVEPLRKQVTALKDTINNLVAVLERIVDEEQARYDQAYRYADAHNNTEGVGKYFGYAPLPIHPTWFDEAVALIIKAKENER